MLVQINCEKFQELCDELDINYYPMVDPLALIISLAVHSVHSDVVRVGECGCKTVAAVDDVH